MGKLKKIFAAVLSSMVVMTAMGVTASAAEANEKDNITANSNDVITTSGELDLNDPEDLLLYNMGENPEAYGMVFLGETSYNEGDLYIVSKSYAEPDKGRASDYSGTKQFFKSESAYDNSGNLLLRTYLWATITWDHPSRTAKVVDGSITARYGWNTEEHYPPVMEFPIYSKNDLPINFYNCGYVRYTLQLGYSESDIRRLDTCIAVQSNGVQIEVPESVIKNH